jgi:RNA polymerase sigma-70 factor (ECF subfamily)
MTEVQLIEACKREESFAQRLLYDQYVERMYLLCLRYVPQEADAEEILSDAFLKCFSNINRFAYLGEGSLRAWLSRIVVNECLMFLRRKKEIKIPIDDSYVAQTVPESDATLSNINVRDILKHIQQLPTGYRTVLNLYVFEDMSHKEIAGLLQITESTSKSQLFKARAMLKQIMNHSLQTTGKP